MGLMNTRRAVIMTAMIMIFSSLAGCLDRTEEEKTAMVSTYHIGELVSAIAGDTINVEMISTTNVPVHDYEPSAADIVRLQESEIFFYHGLNLEPWVESTLSTLGENAPKSVQIHAMPTGEVSLDYESLLIADLCKLMSEGPYENTTLGHGEHEDEDHENDSEEDDAHEEHNHAEAEKTIQNPESCPSDTVISIFHMKEGEHVLEFEEDHNEAFNMAILKMPGGHAHDHHDHDDEDHDDEDHDDYVCHNTTSHENYDSTEADCEAAGHNWMEDDDHVDHNGGVCHNTTTHENYDSTEADCEAAGHTWTEKEAHNHPEIHAENVVHSLSFPEESPSDENHTGEEDHEAGYAVVHIEEEGDYGFAVPKDVEFYILAGDSGPFEWAGIFDISDISHTWSMQKVDGEYADQSMRLVLYSTDDPDEETMHSLEDTVGEKIESDSCVVVEDGESMTSIAADGSCFELHVGTGDDSTFTIETTGISGLAVFSQHAPTEFERDQHYLKDSAGSDIDPVAQESGDAHAHGEHDEHGDDDEIEGDDAEEALAYDPHSWLDPLAFKEQAKVVLDALKTAFPDLESTFTTNAEAYMSQLDTLHADFQTALPSDSTCTDNTVIANHNAYSYLEKRYDLNFLTIHGIDPEGEPSAADIAEVVEEINENGITVIYIEEFTAQSAVDSIVQQTTSDTMPNGINVEYLYTMEMSPKASSDDYISLMRKNMNSLKMGLGC